jgi:predicted Zn finger-like uncharacterized protein
MRVITHCPACQTQFFATEEQLNQHGGKVRCGQCMQVFDARAQLVSISDSTENAADTGSSSEEDTSVIDSAAPAAMPSTSASPTNTIEITDTETKADTAIQQPAYLGDAIRKNRFRPGQAGNKSHAWLWASASLLMVLLAALQSVYFLRDEIAIYYPKAKPYLVQACQKLSCSINLPEKIESIAIDDSDMQEDADHPGLIRFASTLINSGSHVLAYPNLELTLTDVEDKPVLRRIFKPNEYLPAGTNIADGIRAGEETRIKLAITTNDIAVAGYRVFVTY